ncbi:hypothetical protein HUN08_10210 [Gordonia sp. X0973]|uniref:hypothetical protein n=1 Tax=Gordonia sp. X0973 TaxID=2742602 RepID=UPI000F51BCB7|nr:hypothetical protein [Gordonia sp. X0973]QKT07521.1 hypothetical protein HUN08_10210 [Gordonia sp. X0973]
MSATLSRAVAAVWIVTGLVIAACSVAPWADLSDLGLGAIRPTGIGFGYSRAYVSLQFGLGWVSLAIGLVVAACGVVGTVTAGRADARNGATRAIPLVLAGAGGAAVAVTAAAVCLWPLRLTLNLSMIGAEDLPATVAGPTPWVVLMLVAGLVVALGAIVVGFGARAGYAAWSVLAIIGGSVAGAVAVGIVWWWMGRDVVHVGG